MEESPFLCDMTVFDTSVGHRNIETTKKVFQTVNEVKELSNGFVFLFSGDPDIFSDIMEFVNKERLCCPFMGFNINIDPGQGNIWLKIYGREGIKECIKEEAGGIFKK